MLSAEDSRILAVVVSTVLAVSLAAFFVAVLYGVLDVRTS